ncbi:MAG: putative YigZ family protein [Sulfurimonas sp.]|jgi:uncharacterized YigZ family protein
MKYINNIYKNTLEVKQSKFIAYLVPYSDFQQTLNSLKEEHTKARHFVVASRHLNEFNQVVEHSSDDGEPKGTSGKPSLFVLQGSNMINSAVIIVRYFGGTKLGTGGLVRAYSDAVNLVINKAEILEYKQEVEVEIHLEYSNIRMVEYECEIFDVKIVKKTFDIDSIYKLRAGKNDMDLFLKKVNRVVRIVE